MGGYACGTVVACTCAVERLAEDCPKSPDSGVCWGCVFAAAYAVGMWSEADVLCDGEDCVFVRALAE